MTHAYRKAAQLRLFGDLFSARQRARGDKRVGVILLYLLAHTGAADELYNALFAENQQVVQSFWDAVNNRKMEALQELLTKDVVWVSDTRRANLESYPQEGRGPSETADTMQLYLDAFPDLTFLLRHTVAIGNTVVTRWRASGTHTGTFLGLAGTRRSASIEGCTVFEIRDGKIARTEVYWDLSWLMQQLGALGVQRGSR